MLCQWLLDVPMRWGGGEITAHWLGKSPALWRTSSKVQGHVSWSLTRWRLVCLHVQSTAPLSDLTRNCLAESKHSYKKRLYQQQPKGLPERTNRMVSTPSDILDGEGYSFGMAQEVTIFPLLQCYGLFETFAGLLRLLQLKVNISKNSISLQKANLQLQYLPCLYLSVAPFRLLKEQWCSQILVNTLSLSLARDAWIVYLFFTYPLHLLF